MKVCCGHGGMNQERWAALRCSGGCASPSCFEQRRLVWVCRRVRKHYLHFHCSSQGTHSHEDESCEGSIGCESPGSGIGVMEASL